METLRNRLDELTGTFLDIWTGLGSLNQGILPDCTIETPSDGVIWVSGDSTTVQVTSGDNAMKKAVVLHSAPIAEVWRRNAEHGENLRILGNMLVVTLYQEWDEVHRHRIADAMGASADELKVPVFGDLRRFRNDIVHSKGISTPNRSAKTEVLEPFREGDPVYVDIDRWFAIKRAIEAWLDSVSGVGV